MIDHVDTRSTIHARITLAIVDIHFTSSTAISAGTLAHKRIAFVKASAAILARTWIAFVDLNFTGHPTVANRTFALKPQARILTRAMHAGFLRASDGFLLTVRPDPSFHAFAPIMVAFLIVVARSSVQTRHGRTVADSGLAICSDVAGRTLASVRTLSGVEASSSILTRFVVGAEVQILIAEQSTPAFVAEALPGLLAGPVYASRIGFTLVAQGTLPAGLATVEIKNEYERSGLVKEIKY